MNEAELRKAHDACNHNREVIERSSTCGCFHCLNIFPATEVDHYWGGSAVCPYCDVDAVIGDASGYKITPEFLNEMNTVWF
jgi:hypothetical protein